VGFVVGQSGAGQVFSEFFGFSNYSTITLIYHPGKMYNRPICGRSIGAYTNLRDLMGVKSHPTKKKTRNRVARLYPQALGSLLVSYYDLQGYGGDI
jgi:hypothetical protein